MPPPYSAVPSTPPVTTGGGPVIAGEVPVPLTIQPAQLALINVVGTLLAERPIVPAPAWAVKLKPTGLRALTTNDEGVMPVTIEASACGGAFTARNRAIA